MLPSAPQGACLLHHFLSVGPCSPAPRAGWGPACLPCLISPAPRLPLPRPAHLLSYPLPLVKSKAVVVTQITQDLTEMQTFTQRVWEGPRVRISNKLPADADAVGPRSPLSTKDQGQWFSISAAHWNHLRRSTHTKAWVPPHSLWFAWSGVWPRHWDF